MLLMLKDHRDHLRNSPAYPYLSLFEPLDFPVVHKVSSKGGKEEEERSLERLQVA